MQDGRFVVRAATDRHAATVSSVQRRGGFPVCDLLPHWSPRRCPSQERLPVLWNFPHRFHRRCHFKES
ncbi:hypothetical protein MLD38_000694 [Melastoma candidum]|uniref:Uncharacterized protein n=1 Tax=Melastoma candidum TaxID=119954 RepID=A0ACB9SAZ4_9MYRT|nr:hypothetical protein MLD38_000694 [Melastoma candidum]